MHLPNALEKSNSIIYLFPADGEAVAIPAVLRSDQLSLDTRFKITEEDDDLHSGLDSSSSSEDGDNRYLVHYI